MNIYGGGTLDGNGQIWYDLYASNIYTLRPVLIGIDGLHDSIISDLVLRYSPEYYHFVANSTNVVFDNINIAGASKSANIAKNTGKQILMKVRNNTDSKKMDGIHIVARILLSKTP